ncbi:MAG: zinc-dependent metalloprotease, partial [Chitinophagaceae bacterium]
FDEVSRDTSQSMYAAVVNSNIQPIIAAFDINAYTKDSSGYVIEMTNYLNSDNDVLNFAPNQKSSFQIGGMQPDKSYIQNVRSFPMNVEIKTVKTYSRGGGCSPFGGAIPGLGGASAGALYTMEINSSMVMLPSKPMQVRYADNRIGYFTRRYTDFDANPQGVKQAEVIVRWRLEPKDADMEKYKRGELVEPKKQIVYFIDPATPKKWVPYLIQGVNDWQVAFEKAGFKNAIVAKVAPTYKEDSTWSIEDARYSAIVYKPSDIENASGPNVNDPRTGEILESHINWYHNVMQLLRNWYFVQAAAIDPRARTLHFSDSLMGQLIRFVSSHEVGHTLGLQHNFGSSSTVPVENLRNKAWVEANGHTPSIMDYARFNYVAQPEDHITAKGIYPRIGDYDKWAIEWGYKLLPEAKNAEAEVPILSKIATERLVNRRLFFGSGQDDPHSQSEDLGDNAMKASAYGIKNLKRILPNLLAWTYVANEDYTNLNNMYIQIAGQFGRYMGHVSKNIGGIYETDKTVDQKGHVYDFVPKATQQEAMKFLNDQLFVTPKWMLDQKIAELTGTNLMSLLSIRQDAVMNTLTSNNVFSRLLRAEAALGSKAYTVSDLTNDLKKSVWSELYTRKPIDMYRRNLQKSFVDKFAAILNPPVGAIGNPLLFVLNFGPAFDAKRSDIISIAKGTLRSLKSDINAALPGVSDRTTRFHLEDVVDRINQALKIDSK